MTKSEMRRYLLKEQGWERETVLSLSKEELEEIIDHYKYQ